MPLFDSDAYLAHARKQLREMFKLIREGRPFRSSDWEDDEPDIFAQGPEQVIDVKTVRDETLTGTISARQLERHHRDYGDLLHYAIWSKRGRLELTAEELLERAEEYRGSKVRPGKDGRGPYYLYDVSSDTFVDPFAENRRLRGPSRPEGDLQLGLDGSAVRAPAVWTPGPVQLEAISQIRDAGGLAAWEVGVAIHALRGYCPPGRDLRPPRELRPGECCLRAVDDGASLLSRLRDQGRVWKDEQSGLWLLYPEREWALA